MKQVITGDGHFIGQTPTMEAMERDYFYPALGDRLEPGASTEAGASDAWQRANQRARSLLDDHRVDYLGSTTDNKIRSAFSILLG